METMPSVFQKAFSQDAGARTDSSKTMTRNVSRPTLVIQIHAGKTPPVQSRTCLQIAGVHLVSKGTLSPNAHVKIYFNLDVCRTNSLDILSGPPKQDCSWAVWRTWSSCSVSCGAGGFRTRQRQVARQALNGGMVCKSDDASQKWPCSGSSSNRCPVQQHGNPIDNDLDGNINLLVLYRQVWLQHGAGGNWISVQPSSKHRSHQLVRKKMPGGNRKISYTNQRCSRWLTKCPKWREGGDGANCLWRR